MATVKVDMQVGGIAQVRSAFKSVRDTVAQLEQATTKEADRAAKDRQRITERETKERNRLEAQVSREFLRLATVETKAAQKAASDIQRATERSAKERVRAETQANQAISRAAETAAKAQQKSAAETARYIDRVRENSAKAAGRYAAKAADDEAKAAKRSAEQADKRARAMRGRVAGYAGAAGRGIGNVAGAALRLGGMVGAVGGGFALADIGRGVMSSDSASIALANSMYNPNDANQQSYLAKSGKSRFSNTDLEKFAGRAESASGVNKTELLKGWQSYVAKSSDWSSFTDAKGQDSLIDMAKLAKASGSDLGQIMSAAGALKMQNPDLKGDKLSGMMRSIVGQGKMGAVEISDLAHVAGRVTAGATSFATNNTNTQEDNQRKLLGLTQIAMQSAGSSDDAATAVSRFASDVGKHAEKNGMADEVFADKKSGKLKAPSEILAEYFKKTNGNVIKMGEGKGNLGLGMESIKIAQSMSGTYERAAAAAREGGASSKAANIAGANAVRTEVQRFEGAGYSKENVDRDFAAVSQGKQERIDRSMQRISTALETRAAPFFEKLAESFERNGPKIEKFLESAEFDKLLAQVEGIVKFFAGHPFAGLGLVVAGSITKEIAGAGIKELIAHVVKNGIGGAGGGGGAGGAAGAAAGVAGASKAGKALNAAGAVIAAGSAGWTVGQAVGESVSEAGWSSFNESETGANASAARSSKVLEIAKRLKKGEHLSADDTRLLKQSKNFAASEMQAADAEGARLDQGRSASEFVTDGFQNLAGAITGGPRDAGSRRRDAVTTRRAAAEQLSKQLQNVEKQGGVQITDKLRASDFVNLEELGAAITKTMTDAVKAAGNAPTDPNAPPRNVTQGARPPS